MKEQIKELCNLDGVSGYEDDVRVWIEKCVSPYADEMTTDALGNLVVFKKGEKRRTRPMLVCGHMDEVGYLVRKITDSGLLKITQVGGVDPRIAIGQRMKVGPNKIRGIIALKAFHLTTPEERTVAPKEWELSLDIGALSYAEAEKLVSIGDQVTFDSEAIDFGDNCIRAKAIDDRGACAIMIKMLEQPLEYDTWFAFTTNEEIGMRGAPVLARRIDPGVCLCIEATAAIDIPTVPAHMQVIKLRGGAAIPVIDIYTTYNRALRESILKKADEAGIKWQYRTMAIGGTDAGVIHKEGSGALVFGISIPTRFSHTANTISYMPDIENVLALAKLFVKEMGECNV